MPVPVRSPIPNFENGLDATCALAANAATKKTRRIGKILLQYCIMKQNPVQTAQHEIGGCKYGRFQFVFKKETVTPTQNDTQIGVQLFIIINNSIHFSYYSIQNSTSYTSLSTVSSQCQITHF